MARKEDALMAAEAAAVTAASVALGFPVPPTLARNIIASTSSLIVAAVDVPTAWLQGWAARIRATADARADVVKRTVPAVVEAIGADDELKARATMYLGGRMLREQTNRERVVDLALNQISAEQSSSSSSDDAPQAIDEDWLNIFGKLVESRSEETMRAYFARILAGEIRKPGSFAPATLEVLSRMMKEDAERFQRFCNVTASFAGVSCLIAEPYGAPGSNSLSAIGLSYGELCRLQEAGLVQQDLTAWRDFSDLIFLSFETRIGGTTLRFTTRRPVDPNQKKRAKCIHLTRAGEQLLHIARRDSNTEYIDRFVSWAEANFGIELLSRS